MTHIYLHESKALAARLYQYRMENSPRLAMDMPNYLVRQFGSAYSANYHTLLCAVKPFFLSLPGYRRSFLSYA